MKSLLRKLWVLPLFGLIFFWGVSMIGMPSNASLSGNSLIAASQISPIKNLYHDQDESIVTIRGKVSKFKEHEKLVIDDGTDQINVEYQNKYKPLKLNVGELVTVSGELNAHSNNHREIIAKEIWSGRRLVYPQSDYATRVIASNQNQTRFADEDQNQSQSQNGQNDQNGEKGQNGKNGQIIPIAEIFKNARTGQQVSVEGEVIELPEEQMIILRDASGDIMVDIDDAQKTLHLKKGDLINIQANVTNGFDGKKELEATRIEKKKSH